MRRLFYTGGHVLVADQTCKALLRYARALARHGDSDVVTIPAISDTGSRGSAHLLIGPASQMWSVPVESGGDEPIDIDVIIDLEAKTEELQPQRPDWGDEMFDIPNLDFEF